MTKTPGLCCFGAAGQPMTARRTCCQLLHLLIQLAVRALQRVFRILAMTSVASFLVWGMTGWGHAHSFHACR